MRKLLVTGIVQGVGFRPFVYRLAVRHGLRGYVKNLGDAGVEILLIGGEGPIARFTEALTAEKPGNARIDEVRTLPADGVSPAAHPGFEIVESGGLGAPGTIPPDGAVCDACLAEIFGPRGGRRHGYPFTSCVDCGSRLSTIHALPYDRPRTSLARFPMCEHCRREYEDPADRRLHYQGICCSLCGPSYALLDAEGASIPFPSTWAMVEEAARRLRGGAVLAVKGVTGTHIACLATDDGVLERFRKTFGRPQKPFAVMARDLEAVRAFALASPGEEEALLSRARPIVLLTVREGGTVSPLVSPGLRNIGVMLPYAGIHHLLFSRIDAPLLMTSANFPGQPMLTQNGEILRRLAGVVDGFLLHDLEIRNRCDDSVMRTAGGSLLFIRRSRGFAPASIRLPFRLTRALLCLGSELNNTVCLAKGREAFVSQYVGDTTHVETLDYLERAVGTIMDMTRTAFGDLGAVAVDLNPAFDIRRVAEGTARRHGLPLVGVQHHEAHAGSLMGEHGAGPLVVVAVDGIGYGGDGAAWGGEIFAVGEGRIERAAHLKSQRMPGGDAATIHPMRMLAGILFDGLGPGAGEALAPFAGRFERGRAELDVVVRQLERDLNVVRTTSCGRILDAVAALLGLCGRRTYDGEPAMKLEAAAASAAPALEIPVVVEGGVLDTTAIVLAALRLVERGADAGAVAASCQAALAGGLAAMAIDVARARGIGLVGLSGGVAYNGMIHAVIERKVEAAGLRFVTNVAVPCGDGGIAFGQAVVAAFKGGWIENDV
jgi:hydrogenase maturation protein HypF